MNECWCYRWWYEYRWSRDPDLEWIERNDPIEAIQRIIFVWEDNLSWNGRPQPEVFIVGSRIYEIRSPSSYIIFEWRVPDEE